MLAFFARALCGVLLLVGLLSEHRSPAETTPAALGLPSNAAAPRNAPGTSATHHPQDDQHKTTMYRIYRVTAYCDRGVTAAGVSSGVGQCAAPADIPFGARVYIPALDRTFIATDRTARRFRHNTIDLFIPDRDECLKFGRQYLECEIEIPARAVRYGSQRLHATLAAHSP